MAAAPLTTDPTQTDTTNSTTNTSQPPVSQTEKTTQPANPTPIAAPPVTASNATSLATESSQTPAQAPAPVPSQTAPDGRPLTAAEIADKARAQGAGAGASASSAAAGQAGQVQQKAQAAAVNTASTQGAKAATAAGPKAAAPVKTALDIQADALASVPDTIKKMLEGNDPIAKQQFNMLINQVGPKNQLGMEALAMRLRSQGLDGQGAGNALMAMMARDMDYDTNQLIANISSDSAKRIYDLNQWGFTKAQDIAKQQVQATRDNLDLAMKTGQWDQAAQSWGQLFPNIPFDVNAAKATDPNTQAAVSQQSKLVQQLIDQGNPDGAKQAFLTMAKANPEMFGAKSPEEIDAMYGNLDFSKESWSTAQAFNTQVTDAIRTAALQGDRTSAMGAIDRYFQNMTPGAAAKLGSSELSSMSLDEINAVLKANNKAPLQSESDKVGLSAEEFAKDKKYADEAGAAKGANGVDLLLKQITDVHPEVGVDPALRDATRAWLFDNIANLNVSPDGSAVSGYTFKEGAGLPPWDPNSVSGHLYTDWPQASFNDDGSVKEVLYQGGAPYSKDHPRGDLTTPIGQSSAQIDKNYEAYVMNTRANPDTRLGRDDWFYATKGGTQVDPLPQYAKKDASTPDSNPVADAKPEDQTLLSQMNTLGSGKTQDFAQWKDARGSDVVKLDDKTSGQVYSVSNNRGVVAIHMLVNGKYIDYYPDKNTYHIYTGGKSGDQEFSTPEQAIAALGSGSGSKAVA